MLFAATALWRILLRNAGYKCLLTLSGWERTVTDFERGSHVLTVLSQLPVVMMLRDTFRWTQRTASSWLPTAKCFPLLRSHILMWLSRPPQNAWVASCKTNEDLKSANDQTINQSRPQKTNNQLTSQSINQPRIIIVNCVHWVSSTKISILRIAKKISLKRMKWNSVLFWKVIKTHSGHSQRSNNREQARQCQTDGAWYCDPHRIRAQSRPNCWPSKAVRWTWMDKIWRRKWCPVADWVGAIHFYPERRQAFFVNVSVLSSPKMVSLRQSTHYIRWQKIRNSSQKNTSQ